MYLDLNTLTTERRRFVTSSLNNKKYEKVLNNLLGIQTRADHAVFTKLTKMNHDLMTLISNERTRNQILTKPEFKINIVRLSESEFTDLIQQVEGAATGADLLAILNKRGIRLPLATVREIETHRGELTEIKAKITKRLETERITFTTRWKRYVKEVNDAYEQTNIWPLFVGTYFLRAKLDDKLIYAPLLLKEVEVVVEANDVYLQSRNTTVALNEKLIFLLDQLSGLSLPQLKDEIDKVNLNDVIAELNHFLKNVLTKSSFTLDAPFQQLRAQDVTSTSLTLMPGTVLLFAQPLGGALRSATINLINNQKLDDVLKLDPQDFFQVDSRAIRNVVDQPRPIARICPTDPSQEKAILAALDAHTIIIGPPGTGKSQTIANLLTNILLNNKRALFISQKRVALEVVLERLQQLRYFTLQLVEPKRKANSDEKAHFYSYLNKYNQFIKDNFSQSASRCDLKPLVNSKQMLYWQSKMPIQQIPQAEFEDYCQLRAKIHNLDTQFFERAEALFQWFQTLGQSQIISQLVQLQIRDLKLLAQALNEPPQLRFLGFKKYRADFRALWQANNALLDFVAHYNLDSFTLVHLATKGQLSALKTLHDSAAQQNQLVPGSEPFRSDVREILPVLIQRAKVVYQTLHRRDPNWAKRFLGRIERKFTQPVQFINLFKTQLKQMFNVVVSTPEALSTFINFETDRYDYVIFDESSQIFLEKALAYMALADKVIIAGDDQQMQPVNWFGSRFEADEAEQEDENIDSLLTYAIAQGIPKQTLELNYRAAAASLTTFSAREFYDCQLKTLDYNQMIIRPIEIVEVAGQWHNQTNELEAQTMIDILKANVGQYPKIILLTLNAQQMNLVDELLSVNEPELYNQLLNGEIVLKNLENIQGDEADLVIISIAYTKETALSATYVCRAGGRNALNVAITRAKTKMIIIKSLKAHEIVIRNEANLDLQTFKRWVEFLELNQQDQKTYAITDDPDTNNQSVESMFEYEVYQWLKDQRFNKPLQIEVQYPIGSYRIDIALLDSQTKRYLVGLEVDGYRYHSSAQQKYNDLVRQNFIEAKGYKIIRIPELLWKTDRSRVRTLIAQSI